MQEQTGTLVVIIYLYIFILHLLYEKKTLENVYSLIDLVTSKKVVKFKLVNIENFSFRNIL